MDHPIYLARVYDPPRAGDGLRVLLDRLWPRGISKAVLKADHWPKELTPSNDLRRWLHADPARWDGFAPRYRAELAAVPDAVATCLDWCRAGPVTLMTAARAPEHSHVAVLRDYLRERLAGGTA